MNTFGWYELRTTDVAAAAAFYADVLDVEVRDGTLFRGERPVAALSALPERARAAGAPANWLGHIVVADVDAAARAMLGRGGEPLGPPRPAGAPLALLRDPFGAVLALSSTPARTDLVAWHELHCRDRAAALVVYGALFGWRATERLDFGLAAGPYQTFAWADGPPVGAMLDSARSPHVHTHWEFYFRVADLDAAIARARARGANVFQGPLPFVDGARIASCEDPQGAAFSLYAAT